MILREKTPRPLLSEIVAIYSGEVRWCSNRPFYRYGGHIEFIRFKEYYGMPRGVLFAFRAKREFQCIFLGKKAIVIVSKHGTTIFFSHYNLFLANLKEKLARKANVNTDASILDGPHAPWASHNTP